MSSLVWYSRYPPLFAFDLFLSHALSLQPGDLMILTHSGLAPAQLSGSSQCLDAEDIRASKVHLVGV